jgi:predicted ATPase/DNA-binding SARP family transcriptional activator
MEGHGIAFRLLGPVDVTVDGRVVEIGSAKQRALLAALLVRVGTVVPVETLVDDLWGEDPPPAVASTLYSLASRLRRVLADAARLRSRDGGYVLDAAPTAVDAVRFDRLVGSARQTGDAGGAVNALTEALTLWRGAAFGDCADLPFARDEARRLEEARPTAVEDLAEALLALGRPQDALDRLETHVAHHPLRERAWAQTMLALYRLGRQAEALHAFRRLRRALADELGVEPMPQLRRLAERILHQDPDLRPGAVATRIVVERRHNLPVALTSWIGRKRELDDVVDALATARLLTLTGPGGSGKTRLALQAAACVLDRYPDGVWLVELAPVGDPGLVLDAIVWAVGLLPGALTRGGTPLLRGLLEWLRARALLLVLDNCEHVVDVAARHVADLLTRCPGVAVLATSREALDVPGEAVWKVPPLSMPSAGATSVAELAGSDAVALFCERAREARPEFGLSEANAVAVARICRRLDGIPLGLELAAGKIRVLGAAQVAERLDDRFRLLTGGPRTAEDRHRTLRSAMDWSYALLPAAEQALLRSLSVFRGTCTLTAAEAVDADGDVLGPLTRLVDKSMVAVVGDEPEVRYGLLEIVREYASLQLGEAGEAEAVRTRHRDHFLDQADRWTATSGYWNWWWWLGRLSADRDNFAAAMEWSQTRGDDEELLRLAAAHWPHWYWGETLGWRHWLVEAVDRCRTTSPARVEALVALASLLMRAGEDAPRCHALFVEARAVAQRLPDGQPTAQVDFYHAHALLSEGRPKAAEDLLRDGLTRSVNADYLGWCHWCLGSIALLADRVDEAATELTTALELADSVGDDSLRAHACAAAAVVAALRDDGDAAADMIASAVASAERMTGAPRVLLMALAHAGQVAVLTGNGDAAALVARLLGMLRDLAVTYWADEAFDVAALVLADRDPEAAAVALCASRPIDDGDGRLATMRERLRRCRARLGPGTALSPDEAIRRTLAALRPNV